MVLSGSVESFDKDAFRSHLAWRIGMPDSAISLRLAAGSINVTADIACDTPCQPTLIADFSGRLDESTLARAADVGGASLISFTPPIVVAVAGPRKPGADPSGGGGKELYLLTGVVIGVSVMVVGIALRWLWQRRRSTENLLPPEVGLSEVRDGSQGDQASAQGGAQGGETGSEASSEAGGKEVVVRKGGGDEPGVVNAEYI